MVEWKVVIAAVFALIALLGFIWIALQTNIVGNDTLFSMTCGLSNSFTCYWQHGECCSSFVDWCQDCKSKNWQNCPTLSKNEPSWVDSCVSYGGPASGIWQFSVGTSGNDMYGPAQSDANPKVFCARVCVR